jgi:hypothetical protein
LCSFDSCWFMRYRTPSCSVWGRRETALASKARACSQFLRSWCRLYLRPLLGREISTVKEGMSVLLISRGWNEVLVVEGVSSCDASLSSWL